LRIYPVIAHIDPPQLGSFPSGRSLVKFVTLLVTAFGFAPNPKTLNPISVSYLGLKSLVRVALHLILVQNNNGLGFKAGLSPSLIRTTSWHSLQVGAEASQPLFAKQNVSEQGLRPFAHQCDLCYKVQVPCIEWCNLSKVSARM
jgi:hypothetical protein